MERTSTETEEAGADDTLTMLAEVGENVRVTLVVRGAVVTGEIITAHDYFKGLVERRKDTFTLAFPSAVHDALRRSHKALCRDPDERAEAAARSYIHLRDARINGAEVGWWRGRLTAVDAFAI